MAEIDVSPIRVTYVHCMSASQAELGPDAGRITWENCLKFTDNTPLLVTDENRDDVRRHFLDYGAWDEDEVNAWSDRELTAMLWQEAAEDMRHFEDYCDSDLVRYQADCEAGRVSGRLMLDGEFKATLYVGV